METLNYALYFQVMIQANEKGSLDIENEQDEAILLFNGCSVRSLEKQKKNWKTAASSTTWFT